MGNRKPIVSFIGMVLFGAVTAFFLLAFHFYQRAPDGALTSAFAFLLALMAGIGFLAFLIFWVVRYRKYRDQLSRSDGI